MGEEQAGNHGDGDEGGQDKLSDRLGIWRVLALRAGQRMVTRGLAEVVHRMLISVLEWLPRNREEYG